LTDPLTPPTDASRQSTKAPDQIDILAGARLRLQRKLLGMSQTYLGNRVGVAFQQIQKYEAGLNRMGSSRLQNIARELGVPVSYFFEEDERRGTEEAVGALMTTREGINLTRAFNSIRNPAIRRAILELANAAAGINNDNTVREETAGVEPVS